MAGDWLTLCLVEGKLDGGSRRGEHVWGGHGLSLLCAVFLADGLFAVVSFPFCTARTGSAPRALRPKNPRFHFFGAHRRKTLIDLKTQASTGAKSLDEWIEWITILYYTMHGPATSNVLNEGA